MDDGSDRSPRDRYLITAVEPPYATDMRAMQPVANLHEIFSTLRHRWWLIAITMLLGVAAAVLLVRRESPQYVGAALIRLVDERSVLTGSLGDPSVSGSFAKTSEWIQSQVLVLLSRGVAGNVVDREGLRLSSQTPEFSSGRLEQAYVALPPEVTDSVIVAFRENDLLAVYRGAEATASYGELLDLGDVRFLVRAKPSIDQARLFIGHRESAVDAIAPGLSAWPRGGTDAVELRYTSQDPRLAVRLVNAYVQAFREVNATFAQEQIARRRAFLEGQLEQNEIALREAQRALIDFRGRNRVYSSAERIAAEQNTLLQLDTRREELDSDRRLFSMMLARAKAAEGETRQQLLDGLVSAPGLGDSPQIAQLRADVLSHRAELARLHAQLTDLHPDVIRVQAILDQTEERLVTAMEMHIATMESRVGALDDLRDRAAARLEPLPAAEAEELRLVQDVESARLLGEQLRGEYQRARTTEAVEAGQVSIVNLAARPTTGNRHPWVKLGIGAVIGLVLGIGISLLLETLDGSVRQKNELTSLLRVPELGVIPRADVLGNRLGMRRLRINGNGQSHVRNGTGSVGAGAIQLITASRLNSVGSEAYRTLRSTLMFSESGKGVKTLVVTSACVGDGKTTVVANLAVSFAQQGLRVLLIDADLRRPRLHDLFDSPKQPGLSDILALTPDAHLAMRRTAVQNLELITSGTTAPNPAELVGGKRMKTLLETLTSGYDLVLLDTPPVLGAADPIVLAAMVDGALVVVRAGHTSREAAQHAIGQLERVGARVLGAVLNDPDAIAARYGRPYGYGYGYAYATDD